MTVPRGDIEVDVDMENVEAGVYLWGALVTRGTGEPRTPSEYHPFVTWEPVTEESELQTFVGFWKWLSDLRQQARSQGSTFRAYCYNRAAENRYLSRLGIAAGIADEVESFMGSDGWVDLLQVFSDQLMTGRGVGLKAVAPLAGFEWDVDDLGGGESMLRHDVALNGDSPGERLAAQEWLLGYNRGDVEATAALRDWLDSEATALPSIESLEPGSR